MRAYKIISYFTKQFDMVHPLVDKFRECKSLADMVQVVQQNRNEVDEELIQIILEDIINYRNLGNFKLAFDLAEIASLCASILGNEYYVVSSKIAKAELLCLINDFQGTFELCNEIRKNHVLKQEQKAKLFLIEGNAYSIIRDHEKALLYYKYSKAIYDKISDDLHSGIAKLNIARVYLNSNRLVEAEKFFIECEKLFKSKGVFGIMGLAAAIEGRGKVEANRYNYQKSFEFLEKAFKLYLKARAPIRAYYVKLFLITIYPDLNAFEKAHYECRNAREQLSNLNFPLDVARVDWYEGVVYRKEENYDKGLSLLQKAKKVFMKFNAEPDVARILVEEAVIQGLRGNYEESLRLYSESREVFLKNGMKIDAAIIDLNEANVRRHLNQDDEAIKLLVRCLKFAEETQLPLLIYACRALLGNIFEKKNQLHEAAGHYEEAIEIVEKMRINIKHEWFKIRFVLDKQQVYEQLVLTHLRLGQPDFALEFVERSKFQSLLDMMLEESKGERIEFKGMETVQQLLDDGTVVIEYFVTPKICIAFAISRVKFHVKFIDVSEKRLSQMVNSLLNEFENLKEGYAYTIFKLLIEPVKEFIANANRICFIPHKFLYSLPFCALKDNNKYLIEDYQIFYFPSLILFYSLLEKEVKNKNSLLALANPENDLPKSQVEATEISKFFVKKKLLFGNEATKDGFYKFVNEFDIVHVACHGIFEEEKPQESALLLADGPLKAIEIFNFNLNSSLVVLSACMSGKVRIEAGDEIIGLLRGFIRSGARSIVASLWEVAENSSLDFMKVFYEKMQSMRTSEAFQCAQLELMKRYPEPIVWSSYFLMGDHR